jgi:hypothetical protein
VSRFANSPNGRALGPLWWHCDTWKHRGRCMLGSFCLLLWFMSFSPVGLEAFLCKARRFPILANDCLECFIPLLQKDQVSQIVSLSSVGRMTTRGWKDLAIQGLSNNEAWAFLPEELHKRHSVRGVDLQI